MQQAGRRRFASLLTAAALLLLAAGAGAIGFQIPPIDLDPNQLFRVSIEGLSNTGFSIQSRDGSALTINGGSSNFDPAVGLQAGQQVQAGFVLLDGTLSLDVDARQLDGTRARTLTTYRLDVRRRAFRSEHLARMLVTRGRVLDPIRARTRARAMRLADARVMRLVERRDGSARWIRAVRTIREARQRAFRPFTRPDGVLGHFGFAQPEGGDPYVWAVVDLNGKYAVGLTVDRDGDSVPNSEDNCVGSNNPNQSDADTDGAGDACDFDDDNDGVLDVADACPATAVDSLVSANGCSIADTCPCESSWRNHGAYVKCVAQTSNSFVSAGLMTSAEKDVIVSAGAQSVCGF